MKAAWTAISEKQTNMEVVVQGITRHRTIVEDLMMRTFLLTQCAVYTADGLMTHKFNQTKYVNIHTGI